MKGVDLVANELLFEVGLDIYVVIHMVEFYVIIILFFLKMIVNERDLYLK